MRDAIAEHVRPPGRVDSRCSDARPGGALDRAKATPRVSSVRSPLHRAGVRRPQGLPDDRALSAQRAVGVREIQRPHPGPSLLPLLERLPHGALYTQLELQRRKRLYPWPAVIGLDEHYFRRGRGGFRQFVSMVVDFRNRRLMELVEGRSVGEMEAQLAHIPGRENVRFVVTDLCDPFKTFARGFFPNAQVVADKFHVLRLLIPHINRRRKLVTGDRRSAAIRRLLLRSRFALDHVGRWAVDRWLELHPDLRALYEAKETMHSIYRIRGRDRAAAALTAFTDRLATAFLPELQTFRRTLLRWRNEILAYFGTGLTNGRTEGFNNKAKLVKKRAYGYRSFPNYRLRLLNACA